MAYSMDFRIAVAAAYDECHSSLQVAARFGCSQAWVRRLIQRRRESSSLAPRTANRQLNFKLNRDDHELLRTLVNNEPNITLSELAKALGNKASIPTVWRTVCALGLWQKRGHLRHLPGQRPPVRLENTSAEAEVSGASTMLS